MKVVITGGSGFIGTNLISFYIDKEVEVINLDTVAPRNPDHRSLWKQVDIMDKDRLRKEIVSFSPTHIFHLAATTGVDTIHDINLYAANFKGVENLIDACRELPDIQRIIFTSSMLVCRSGYLPNADTEYCPNTVYGESKVLGEEVVRGTKDLPCSWVIVRPVGIWGPWFGTPYREFFRAIAKGLYVHPRKRGANQALGFAGNTVHQYHILATASSGDVNGTTFYLADPSPLNLRTWSNMIQVAIGARRIFTMPTGILKVVALLGDLTKLLGWKSPPLTSFRLKNMQTDLNYPVAPIIAEGLPFTLEEGVQETVNWLYQNGDIANPGAH